MLDRHDLGGHDLEVLEAGRTGADLIIPAAIVNEQRDIDPPQSGGRASGWFYYPGWHIHSPFANVRYGYAGNTIL